MSTHETLFIYHFMERYQFYHLSHQVGAVNQEKRKVVVIGNQKDIVIGNQKDIVKIIINE
jgi:hypothetical protein